MSRCTEGSVTPEFYGDKEWERRAEILGCCGRCALAVWDEHPGKHPLLCLVSGMYYAPNVVVTMGECDFWPFKEVDDGTDKSA